MPENCRILNLAVLLSGSGRTLQNFVDLIKAGNLPARIVVVVSSVEGAYGLERAKQNNIPAHLIRRKDFPDKRTFSDAIAKCLSQYQIDYVLMAGFLHLFLIADALKGKVVNIHPALLPKFGGKGMYYHHVHEAVLKAGEKESGCTVHFADDVYDHGHIILQRSVPVLPGDTADTLADRVFKEECIAYPEAVRLLAEGKVSAR
jgi:formyltetrahydrofolate-dependent phosphoribosylglycinamide formyltransferase